METKTIFIACSEQTSETGCSISQIAACAGFSVSLKCDGKSACTQAANDVKRIMEDRVARGELQADQVGAALARIKTTTELSDAKDAQIVIESLFEDEDLKRKAINELDKICAPGTVIATNSSTLTVTSLARATTHPERVVGMHFVHFSPIMKVVEIARGARTSDDAYTTIETMAKDMGQEIALSEDTSGLLSTRIWLTYINEAANNVHEKLATPEGLKALSRVIAPRALSPLESADFIGLDNCVALLQNLHRAYGDPKYSPSTLLVWMVDARQLGIKSGQGFFNYT